MNLIVDANILISALIAPLNKTKELLFLKNFTLFAPEFILEEIEKYREEIIKKSGLTLKEFGKILFLICTRISFIPSYEFKEFLYQAQNICPDENDIEYFALALKLQIPLWSNDKALKKQKIVQVYSTEDLLKL